ncbi:MAG: SRPBCC family protein [Flavisolibacter sp.]
MSFIHLTNFIAAPQDRVFDLSRSVDLHKLSMKGYGEKIVEGTFNGLMKQDDTVTWMAKHLFKERKLKVKITRYERPDYFVDEQVEGDFGMMKHEHYFKPIENGTIMIDQFHYEMKNSVLGKLVNRFYLEKYMTSLLNQRNQAIKLAAESNQWKQILS